MKDKKGLLVTGKKRTLSNIEPSINDRTLWLRWFMATEKVTLVDAFNELQKRLERKE